MAQRNRYRIEDTGDAHRYMPGPLYYIGMAYCLFVVGGNLWSAIHYQGVDFFWLFLCGAFLIGLIGAWRLIIVDVHEVRVWSLGFRRRFPLHGLGGMRTHQTEKSALTPGNYTSAVSAVSHVFHDTGGKLAFRISPWIWRRQECARLIQMRIRRAREGALE